MIITKKGAKENTIVIEENFRASREKVFKAWTKPESLKKWFMADEGVVVQDAMVDLHVDGKYFIQVLFPGFDPSSIHGKFLKVEDSEHLEYTWLTEVLNGRTTLVSVQFINLEQGSKIHLSHGEFENEQEMKLHIDGWKGCLSQLHTYLKSS